MPRFAASPVFGPTNAIEYVAAACRRRSAFVVIVAAARSSDEAECENDGNKPPPGPGASRHREFSLRSRSDTRTLCDQVYARPHPSLNHDSSLGAGSGGLLGVGDISGALVRRVRRSNERAQQEAPPGSTVDARRSAGSRSCRDCCCRVALATSVCTSRTSTHTVITFADRRHRSARREARSRQADLDRKATDHRHRHGHGVEAIAHPRGVERRAARSRHDRGRRGVGHGARSVHPGDADA